MKKNFFEKILRAFFSIISMEQEGCEFSSSQNRYICSVGKETGWNPATYFFIHIAILKEAGKLATDEKIKNIITRHTRQTEKLLDFENTRVSSPAEHLVRISNIIKNPKGAILYPWGPIDHQTYIDLWHKPDGKFSLRIFDLGAGRVGESAIRDHYQPLEYLYDTREEVMTRMNELINLRNHPILDKHHIQKRFDEIYDPNIYGDYNTSFVKFYNYYYREAAIAYYAKAYGPLATRAVCESCLPEIKQSTGNCVVKNLFAAFKQDIIDLYGVEEGCEIFKKYYLLLIEGTLKLASEHAEAILDKPLPSLRRVCQSIQQSQTDFTCVACHNIISGRVFVLYEQLSQQAQKTPYYCQASSNSSSLWSKTPSAYDSISITLPVSPSQSTSGGCC